MATDFAGLAQGEGSDRSRDQWLERLSDLIAMIRSWARELDWSTRDIVKKMKDSQLGAYDAPALVLQKETARILLEPITHSAPGTQGVVDLYLMPALDDVASLYFYDDRWHLHYMFPDSPTVANIRDAESIPLSKEAIQRVLEGMTDNVA